MNLTYKQFNIDNSAYIFCVEDFEIFKIPEIGNVEQVLQEIKSNKKSNSKIERIVKDDFFTIKKVDTIGVDIANGCTLDCAYCYISASGKSKKKLSKEKFVDILSFLKKIKDDHVDFFFTGAGEPTLNFDLIKEIPSLCKEHGFDKCIFDLTTNGTILTNEMIDFFKANKFVIYISLDGNEEINNASRIYPNGKGSFNDVFRNMKLLRENGIEFSCKTVVRPDNKHLVETFSFFEENNIHFKFSISTHSFDNHFLPNIEDFKNFEEQMELVVNYYREIINNNHKVYANKIIFDLKRIHYGGFNRKGCGASKDGFYIDIDGNLFPCSYHSSSKDLSVGNIYTGIDYEKIINNKFYAKPVDSYSACKDCWMKYLCSGSCFAIKWLENKDTDEPSKYLCKYNDIYWSAIIKLYTQIHPTIAAGNSVNFIDETN